MKTPPVVDGKVLKVLHPTIALAIWRQGCSCAMPEEPERCPDCTKGAIEAIELWLEENLSDEQKMPTYRKVAPK